MRSGRRLKNKVTSRKGKAETCKERKGYRDCATSKKGNICRPGDGNVIGGAGHHLRASTKTVRKDVKTRLHGIPAKIGGVWKGTSTPQSSGTEKSKAAPSYKVRISEIHHKKREEGGTGI